MPRLTRGENQGYVRNLFPAYRVYVGGENVTELVTSVRTQWPDGSPSEATIELVNPNKLLTITRSDIITIGNARFDLINQTTDQGIVDRTNQILFTDEDADLREIIEANNEIEANRRNVSVGDFTESVDKLVSDRFKDASRRIGIEDVIASTPLSAKVAGLKSRMVQKKQDLKFIQGTTSFDGSAATSEPFFKWPFYEGLWIFHHQDPVRVAFRDPYDPSIWYWMHAGTITDINERETDNLQSTVTINSEGVLKDLRYARIANVTTALLTPDQITSIKDQQTGFSGEQLSKLQATVFSNFLQNSTLDQVVELVVFGSTSVADQLKQSINAITNGTVAPEVALVRFGFNPSLLSKDTSTGTSGNPTTTASNTTATSGNISQLIQSAQISEEQFRGMNIDAISNFKRFSNQQGLDVRIIGGPVGPVDELIGAPIDGLFDWQSLLDHQVRLSDIQTMAFPENTNRRGATSDVAFGSQPSNPNSSSNSTIGITTSSIEDTIDQIGEDIQTYPIRQRVKMLLPANLGPSLGREVLDRDFAASPAMQAEYYDRLSLLQQIVERIEFSLYDTPRGDIVIEHPLYDFEPRHFSGGGGTNAFNQSADSFDLTDQQMAELLGVEDLPTPSAATIQQDNIGNKYQNNYVVGSFETISVDIGSSEENVKTVMVCTPRLLPSISGDNSRRDNRQVLVSLPNLVPLYGFRLEQGDVLGSITTVEAARLWGHVMLNRMNADMVSMRVPALPNWCSWPNRPHYIQTRNVMAVTKSVCHTIAWQSDCSTEYGVNHCKFWDGRTQKSDVLTGSVISKPLVPRFVPFGGVNARPFNYSDILRVEFDQRGQPTPYNAANKAPQ